MPNDKTVTTLMPTANVATAPSCKPRGENPQSAPALTTDDDAPDRKIEYAIALLSEAGYEIRLNGMKVEMTGKHTWRWVKA